jgi:hypothetical protein
MVASHTIHACGGQSGTTEKITAANDQTNFYAYAD